MAGASAYVATLTHTVQHGRNRRIVLYTG